jgi:hypothetical protein
MAVPKSLTLLNIVGWLALAIGTVEFIRQQHALLEFGDRAFDSAGNLADSAIILVGVAASLAAKELKDLTTRISNLETKASDKPE